MGSWGAFVCKHSWGAHTSSSSQKPQAGELWDCSQSANVL